MDRSPRLKSTSSDNNLKTYFRYGSVRLRQIQTLSSFSDSPSPSVRLSLSQTGMVIPPPVRPPRITNFLKPYVLKMHFTNKYVTAQVIHTPTATVASSASSQEKALRSSLETTRDVAAAAKIGKLLAERLSLKDIPAVSVHLKREQSAPLPPEVQALGLWKAIEWLAK
ncbi:hypothetical protein P8452_10991 [Trifolium repens]|nr:hypothetical protein P8452_10991 [Trifolium repens]